MKQVRKVHFWLGTFFAPAIVFFALSGALQILGLHEGSGAMGWVAKLAQIHKDQSIGTIERRARPPRPEGTPEPARAGRDPGDRPASAAEHEDGDHDGPPRAAEQRRAPPHRPSPSKPLKFFFLLMSASLILSSVLGVYMALQYERDRTVIFGLLTLGTIVPIALMFL